MSFDKRYVNFFGLLFTKLNFLGIWKRICMQCMYGLAGRKKLTHKNNNNNRHKNDVHCCVRARKIENYGSYTPSCRFGMNGKRVGNEQRQDKCCLEDKI